MRKSVILLAVVLYVVVIGAVMFRFLYAPDKRGSAPATKPEMGLGYHPPDAAYVPGSGIKNSPHDMSASSTYPGVRRYNPEGKTNSCVFCHVPKDTEKEESDVADVPLWKGGSSAISHFTPYDSGPDQPKDPNHRLSADVSQGPGDVSLFCLGCHDGTVADNSYGSINASLMPGPSKVGANGVLSNHHPIGFQYAAVNDKEIDPSATLGKHSVHDLLKNGRMECTTCHDVHNKENTGEKLLWVSDRNSDLCCSCHQKCSN